MNVTGKNLLVRADASAATGTGHVMRSLALAQAWQDQGGKAWFACCHLPGPLKERLEQENLSVYLDESLQPGSPEDARWTLESAQQCHASWISVDGYCFKSGYQKQLKDRGARVLFFDDYGHCDFYHADLVLNGNVTAQTSFYEQRDSDTRLLLGTGFAPLRREFRQVRKDRVKRADGIRRILLTMGGSDPDNCTCKILQLLHSMKMEQVDVTVLVGGGNPHLTEIQTLLQHLRFPCILHVNATHMPELMKEADLAVAAGGSTYLEALYMKLPCLLFVLADNQFAIARRLAELGATQVAGDYRTMSDKEIGQALGDFLENASLQGRLLKASRDLVDGRGVERILEAMLQENAA